MEHIEKHTFAVMAYKAAPYLEETIESVLSQNVRSNVYIATSTPTERIESVADKYQMPLYVNKGKSGIVGDWEFALSCASTPYVTLVDQDDIYHPDYARAVTELLDAKSDSLIVFTNYIEIDHAGNIRENNMTMSIKKLLLWPFLFSNTIRGGFRRMILKFGDPVCSPSITYNIKNLGGVQLFDDRYSISLDWDALLRMTERQGSFCYCKRKLLRHRIHENTQTSGGISEGKRYQEDFGIFKRLWPLWMAKIMTKAYTASYRTNK